MEVYLVRPVDEAATDPGDGMSLINYVHQLFFFVSFL